MDGKREKDIGGSSAGRGKENSVPRYEVANEELKRKAVVKLEGFVDRQASYGVEVFSDGWALRKEHGMSIEEVSGFLGVHDILTNGKQVVGLEQWHRRVITGRSRFEQALNDVRESERNEMPERHLRPGGDAVREVHGAVRAEKVDREVRKQLSLDLEGGSEKPDLKKGWSRSARKTKRSRGRSW